MKKILLLAIVCLFAMNNHIQAQAFTANVPMSAAFDSTYILGQGMTDSFDISQHFQGYSQGQFYLCTNSTLIFKGNQSSTMPDFFLAPGAKLILKDSYFYPSVYLSSMSELDAQGGIQNITLRRVANSIVTDTANVNWMGDTIYSTMNFTFTGWPNASDPCSLSPNGLNNFETLTANVFVLNNSLQYNLSNQKSAELSLFDMHGRKLLTEEINTQGQIHLSQFASGIYLVNILQGNSVVQKKIFLD